jgi:putative tricarboxylic transport membrane protein
MPGKTMIREKKDIASGLFLFAFGLFLAIKSLGLSVWSKFGPDEGFFPLAVAILMMALSVTVLIKAVGSLKILESGGKTEEEASAPIERLRIYAYAVLMFLYAVLLEKVGFLITSALFLLLIVKLVERESWLRTVFVGVISIVTSYVLFVYFLGVPLPKGFLK